MILPNKRLVSHLQSIVEKRFYVDSAKIIYRTQSSLDSYGQAVYSETTTEVDCSFTDKSSQEAWAGYADIESIEAELRFVGDKPNKGDLVTLENRFNESGYTTETFEIVAIKDRSTFGFVLGLKKVRI